MTKEKAISRIQQALSVPNRLQGLVLIDEESANMAIEALFNNVEVVKCKDCKYNGIWCDIQDIEWTEKGKPIEFCSYGERKKE